MPTSDPRRAALATALADAARQQGVTRVADLDFDQLAAAVDALDPNHPVATPLDPEGDGLTPPELNAANDG